MSLFCHGLDKVGGRPRFMCTLIFAGLPLFGIRAGRPANLHGFSDICKTFDFLLQLFLPSVSCRLQLESRTWFSYYSCRSKWRSVTCTFSLEVILIYILVTAGKSTLLHLLAGKRLISMAGTELKVKGCDVFRDSPSGVTFLGTEWSFAK